MVLKKDVVRNFELAKAGLPFDTPLSKLRKNPFFRRIVRMEYFHYAQKQRIKYPETEAHKIRRKKRQKTDKYKSWRKTYMKAYRQTQKYKAQSRAYQNTAKFKEYHKRYYRRYYQQRDKNGLRALDAEQTGG